ncbi:MAG: hypothetical protein KY458_05090 [Actinobacteria bacterium]|nr:hypothetical protein [Actinomycetota bacterium]
MTEGRPRSVAVAVAVAATLAAVALVVPPPVRAQPADRAAAAMNLRSQTTWWKPGEPFTVSLAVRSERPEELVVAASLHRAMGSRTEFGQAVQGRLSRRPLQEVPPAPVVELPVDEEGYRAFSFTPEVTNEGVYPLRVELRRSAGGPVVDTFVTFVVNAVAPTVGRRLAVATILPLHAPPAVQPDGRVAIDDERAEELAELARSLDNHPDVGFTLAATPESAEALRLSPREQDRATLDSFVRALRLRQLLAGSYVPTNLTAMLEAGLEGEAAAQLTAGTETLRSIFDGSPTITTRLVDERLSDAGLAYLQDQGVERLVVPEGLLEPAVRNTTLAEAFDLVPRAEAATADASARRVRAAMADSGLARHFAGRQPELAAHTLLADLAVVYLDSPGAPRGVVVSPGRGWEPSGAFTDILLEGLASSPILEGVTLDEFFAAVPVAVVQAGSAARPTRAARGDRDLLRKIAPPPSGSPTAGLPATEIRTGRRRLEAFASALEPTNPVLARIDVTLLAAQSADLRARERNRYLAGASEQIDAELAGLSMPQNRSITLTAREGEIPITVTSTLGYPVRGVLRVDSDTLDFPEGASRELALVRRNTTLPLMVRAQASGSFPLRVRLQSPTGSLLLASSRYTVRSTAVSGVGTALSAGAALFLLVWWGNHLRIRRSRRLVPA